MNIVIMRFVRRGLWLFLAGTSSILVFAQHNLSLPVMNVSARKTINLNGRWQYIVDPYETGFYDYRWVERRSDDPEAYWNEDLPRDRTDRKEFSFVEARQLQVPGDWNSQSDTLLYYEGTVWYQRTFDFDDRHKGSVHLCFGAVNYHADVFLNGTKLGSHLGGFTPFGFSVPLELLRSKGNNLVVKVDNRRYRDEVPTLNTDWWNYGGVTRDVQLVLLPDHYIERYMLNLDPASLRSREKIINGWVKLGKSRKDVITIRIPELRFSKTFPIDGDSVGFSVKVKGLELWSPENPRRYSVEIATSEDEVSDKIGFRTVRVKGKQLLVNGSPVFLRGISIHEEIPGVGRRATTRNDALYLLTQAKELNANMVRLAHYPHNEHMISVADSLGLFVWSEIPVYWTIDFGNPIVLEKARTQLREMIERDRNRCSVIIWSVGNETPVRPARTEFMKSLIGAARRLDSSRLISAALEYHGEGNRMIIDDPLGEWTDIVAVNEYVGWYNGLPSRCRDIVWEVKYDKPLFFSETGAEAPYGFHADSLTRWSEEYQEWYYREQVGMLNRMPDNYVGVSPWLLNDFRSPKRNNYHYQNGWNNKGLIDRRGRRKLAYDVLKDYYDRIASGKR